VKRRPALSVARLRSLRRLATHAAISAGRKLKTRANLDVVSATGKDIKLAADRWSERMVVKILQRSSDFPILSEEGGAIDGIVAADGPFWIVDPIDGSFNYFRGIPACCVSVALWSGGQPLVGVIYDFMRRELFAAVVGDGASLNGEAITVSAAGVRRQRVLFTGIPLGSTYTPARARRVVREWMAYKKVRMTGSAALALAYVACGRGDDYREDGIMFWDVAAGLAIVRAAGGTFVMRSYGERAHCLSVAARGRQS
jgi:myo-inositol-1(or 4)-monophosphatase